MVIGDEHRDVGPGDLVYIPPDAVHSLETKGDDPIHCFCFAVGVEATGRSTTPPTDHPHPRARAHL